MKRLLCLLALGLLGGAQLQEDPRIRDLVDRLQDDSIDVREKAAQELAEFGKAALPALEKLRGSADAEVRSRAASILTMISESETLHRHWRPGPRITLDVERAPLARVLDEIARQAHDSFTYIGPALQDPVSLKMKGVTFWESLDLLCHAAPALTWDSIKGVELEFMPKARPPYPAQRQGEFLVWLERITFTRDYDFTGVPRSTYILNLSSAWEAGVVPIAVDQRITEILDEDGANLILPDRFPYGARLEAPGGRIRRDGVFVPLPQGAKGIRKFSRIRGSSTFFFPRSYEDVSMDLRAGSPSVTCDRMTVSVRNFRAQKDSCGLEVILTSAAGAGEPLIDRLPYREIALVDDQGGLHRAPSSSRSHSFNGTTFTIHENLQVPFPEGRSATGLTLRVLKEVLEKRVPFEFTDIAVE